MKRKDYKKRKNRLGKRLAIKVALLLTFPYFLLLRHTLLHYRKKQKVWRLVHMKPSLTGQNPKFAK